MAEIIKQIKLPNVTGNYDIHDNRIADFTSADIGKPLVVGEAGSLIPGEVATGGTVKSVNGNEPDGTGNVSLDYDDLNNIPTDIATQSYVTTEVGKETTARTTALNGKVDKVDGKGLSTNDYTTTEKNKLSAIEAGAQKNVQSDWNATSGDALILNKPEIPSIAGLATETYVNNAISPIQASVTTIEGKIPSQASSSNQLADKNFVNSSIQTYTANFRGSWATWAAVPTDGSAYPVDYKSSTIPTTNDYMVVVKADDYSGQDLQGTWRFKYSGTWNTDGKNGWHPEYQVNETPLTAQQLAALNSGIDATAVAKLGNIAPGAEVNQNAFSNIKVGTVTIAADSKTDTAEFVAGSHITLTPNATNDSITVATDFDNASTTDAGLMSAADKTKLEGIAAGATNVVESTVSGWGFTKNAGSVTSIVAGNGLTGGTITGTGTIAVNTDTIATRQYAATVGPVTSVNGGTGAVSIAAVPSGGTTNQVLTKTASGYGWADAAGGGTTITADDYLTQAEIEAIIGQNVFWDGGIV